MSELVNGFDTSIVDERASKVGPAGIDIAYQRLGNPDAPLVLLIMGIAAQSIHWPDAFCRALVDYGLQVIRFDNRDAGLSTHLTDAPPPDLRAALAGDLSSVSYTLSDMAADAVGLLDVLGFGKAHVVGASMGGQIAQTMALEHPDRVRSLTSMMSTTGNRSVGLPSPDVLREVFSGPGSHPRRSHSANASGCARLWLAWLSERRKRNRRASRPRLRPLLRSGRHRSSGYRRAARRIQSSCGLYDLPSIACKYN